MAFALGIFLVHWPTDHAVDELVAFALIDGKGPCWLPISKHHDSISYFKDFVESMAYVYQAKTSFSALVNDGK